MANRTLSILLQKIHKNGDIDKIFFKTRAKDVVVNESNNTTLVDVVNKVNGIQAGATATAKSNTNGNVKINNTETQVYKHPESGVKAGSYNSVTVDANGHVTQGTNVSKWTGSVSGDASDATVTYSTATGRSLPATKESLKTIMGKITKYLTDLKTLAFTDKVGTSNLDSTLTTFYNKRVTTDNVTTSTSITAAGWIADARAIASLQNQINTINSNLAGKAASSHTHDDRYYTESEMNTKLNAKQNTLKSRGFSPTINSTYLTTYSYIFIRQWGAFVYVHMRLDFKKQSSNLYRAKIASNMPPILYSAESHYDKCTIEMISDIQGYLLATIKAVDTGEDKPYYFATLSYVSTTSSW